jgi:imidazoleglycerol-phosphate dehydratase
VEDIGIALGQAVLEALGDKKGIVRYGNFLLPMDEALVLVAIDLSGRDTLGYQVNLPTEKVGTFDTELAKEFWLAFVRRANLTLHIRELAGENTHHVIEGTFKSFGRTMRTAVAMDPEAEGEIPSTKGVL